jgi:hypothetical protein
MQSIVKQTSSSKKLINGIKKVVINAGRKVRSLFTKKNKTAVIQKQENEPLESNIVEEMTFSKKCEVIVDTGIEASRSIYQLVKEDYFPVAVEFYQNHKNILNFIKPEAVTLVESVYPVIKSIMESESVKKSCSLLSLIKNVSIEAAQIVINKFSNIRLNVEMIVAEATDAIENGDLNKMVAVACKVLVNWDKTRIIVEMYQNMSVDYVLEIVGNWLMDTYIR